MIEGRNKGSFRALIVYRLLVKRVGFKKGLKKIFKIRPVF